MAYLNTGWDVYGVGGGPGRGEGGPGLRQVVQGSVNLKENIGFKNQTGPENLKSVH